MGCGVSANTVGPEPLKVHQTMPYFSPGSENLANAPTAPSSVRDEDKPRKEHRPTLTFAASMLDGWSTLYSVTESNIKSNFEKAKFFENLADIEKQYSQKLLKLVSNTKSNMSKIPANHRDVGTTAEAWDTTLSSVEKIATQHAYAAETIERDVFRQLDKWAEEYERRQKKIVSEGKRIQKEFKQLLDDHQKKKQTYMDTAKVADQAETNYNIQKNDPSNAARAQSRHTEAQVKLSNADRDYKASVKDTNHRQHQHYTFQQPELLTNFENLESERLIQLKDVSSNFAKVQATLVPIYTTCINAIVSTTGRLDTNEDVQTWLYANKTGRDIPPDFQYVSFKMGDAQPAPPPPEPAEAAPAPPPEEPKPVDPPPSEEPPPPVPEPPPPEPAAAAAPPPPEPVPEPEPPKPEPKPEEPKEPQPPVPTPAPAEPAAAEKPAEPSSVQTHVKVEMSFPNMGQQQQQQAQPPPGFVPGYPAMYPAPYPPGYPAMYPAQYPPGYPPGYPQYPVQQPPPQQQWQPAQPSYHQQQPQQQPPPQQQQQQQPYVVEQVVELPRAPAAQPVQQRPTFPTVDSPRRAKPEPVKTESPRQMTPRRLASLHNAASVTTMAPPIASLRPLEVAAIQAPLVMAPPPVPAPAPAAAAVQLSAPLPELNLTPLQLPLQFTQQPQAAGS